ncbi:MAG TPA: MarR family winged helix-turn-helix transcriptional regulator [Pseudorhodoferax sp.]|jgi:DNA-binding MarR family transcriptional regulator|nr:MarR family winged helix-turn-helix transcriptional regulator [Pseudorhodoferax sp.]
MRESVDKVNRYGRHTPVDDEVLELVHQVMHQFRSQLFQSLRQGAYELTHMESKVLGFYARHPGATQRDLVEHTGRDKAQLARLIKGLRERGLLQGEADTVDRRNVRLQPTAEGLAIQHALREQAKALEAQAVVGMAQEERAQLLALLRRVQDNLNR